MSSREKEKAKNLEQNVTWKRSFAHVITLQTGTHYIYWKQYSQIAQNKCVDLDRDHEHSESARILEVLVTG